LSCIDASESWTSVLKAVLGALKQFTEASDYVLRALMAVLKPLGVVLWAVQAVPATFKIVAQTTSPANQSGQQNQGC
jgi:hypothetical protein